MGLTFMRYPSVPRPAWACESCLLRFFLTRKIVYTRGGSGAVWCNSLGRACLVPLVGPPQPKSGASTAI